MSYPFVSTTFYGCRCVPHSKLPCGSVRDKAIGLNLSAIFLKVSEPETPKFHIVQEPTFIKGTFIARGTRPQDAPFIYERDILDEEAQKKWTARIEMINRAHRCHNIFTLSIVPKNPDVTQTWYHKNSRSIPTFQERILHGFIEPFLGYSVRDFLPQFNEENLSQMEPIILEDREDIEAVDPDLKDLATYFLKDEESASVGITFLQPTDPECPIRHLWFIKA